MDAAQYREYLRSSAWQPRRARFERTHPPVCEACGSTERAQLHHRDYSRLGRDRDADLVFACNGCAESVVLVPR